MAKAYGGRQKKLNHSCKHITHWIFHVQHVIIYCMGFGSYDESEQENQEFNTDFEDEEGVETGESVHEGDMDFEMGASNDELLDRLKEMKD